MQIDTIHLSEKLEQIHEYWQPHIIGELNGQYVKVAKLKGEFVWHHHEAEDELFQVLRGILIIELPDKTLVLNEGDIAIIPRGVAHRPIAKEEVHILLFEPIGTLNTGNVESERTLRDLKKI